MLFCPKISVIIPVYNVEKYLNRCIDSVLKQTYKNLEIILVNDGSSDNCPQICDEYAQYDNRIIVIHKKNGGLSSARNAAFDSNMTGDYIAFIDSDDWIEPDTYAYCVNLIEKYGAEIVQYDACLTSSFEHHVVQPTEQINEYYGKEVLQYFMLRSTKASGGYTVWGAIYKKDLLNGLRFRDGKVNEDIDYKFKAMQRCQKLVVSNQIKYNYFQSGNTLSAGGLKERDFQLREAADLLCELASEEDYGSIAFLGRVKKARTAFSLLSKIAYYGIADTSLDEEQIIKELTAEHRKNFVILMKAPIPISRKVLAILFALNYNLAEKVISLAK